MEEPITLWKPLQKKLENSHRPWLPSDVIPYRFAKLLCVKCGKVLGKFDIVDTDLTTYLYCSDCVKPYIKPTPIKLDAATIIEDFGNYVKVEYVGGYYEKIVVTKTCYFTNKGRYIKIKNKRYYI